MFCLHHYLNDNLFQFSSIQTIDHGAFDILESAQWMYIHSNQLTALCYDTFRPVIDNLHVLDLHGELDCSHYFNSFCLKYFCILLYLKMFPVLKFGIV